MKLHVLDAGATVTFRKPPGPLRTPVDVACSLRELLRKERREVFLSLMLNTRHNLFRVQVVSIGSLNASLVHPREVFAPAIEHRAASLILCHNHPSKQETPSEDDVEMTKRLVSVGDLVGIEILDHLIIGGQKHFSFREAGLL